MTVGIVLRLAGQFALCAHTPAAGVLDDEAVDNNNNGEADVAADYSVDVVFSALGDG